MIENPRDTLYLRNGSETHLFCSKCSWKCLLQKWSKRCGIYFKTSHVFSTYLYSKEQCCRLTNDFTTPFIHYREFCVSLIVLLQILFPLESFRVEKNFHSTEKHIFPSNIQIFYPRFLVHSMELFGNWTPLIPAPLIHLLYKRQTPPNSKGTKTEEPRRIDAKSNTTDVDGSPSHPLGVEARLPKSQLKSRENRRRSLRRVRFLSHPLIN